MDRGTWQAAVHRVAQSRTQLKQLSTHARMRQLQGPPGGSVVKNPPAHPPANHKQSDDPWVRKIPWRRKWQSTPVFLSGESHGQRSLVGYSPWGSKESDTTHVCERLSTHSHETAPGYSVQFGSFSQSCPTLCDPMNHSTPGLPVHHQLPEFIQTHAHRVGDAIQPSHPLSSSSPPAPNPFQHQGLFQRVNSLHEVAKVLEFQLQHQSFQ